MTDTTTSQNNLNKPDSVNKLQSQLENLEYILADKESFIDNLISRSGDLESIILQNNEQIGALSDEKNQIEQHIESLNQAIVQRDTHVAHLEQKNNQLISLAEKNHQAEQTITK